MKKEALDQNDLNLLAQYGLQNLDLQSGYRLCCKQNEFLSHAGDPIDCIFFVVSGKAKVFVSLSNGKQLLLAYFTSKGIIGDIELMTNKPTNYTTVQAVTEFSCIALPLDVYGAELKSNIDFVNYIAQELAKKLTQRVINGAITTLQPIEARVCAYISQSACDGFFHETLTEVAISVGASYRHLLRCLDKLCADGILGKEPPGFRIIDQVMVDRIAVDLYYSQSE